MLKFFKTTIVAKVVMAITGLICIGFLFVHAIGNLQYFIGPDTYNSYAYFLQSLGEILWIIRGVLIVSLILHVISAIYLRLYNNAAKPVQYKIKNYVKAKLTSRTMLWTGILVLSGLTFHLLHFTVGTIDFMDGYHSYEIVPTGNYVLPECSKQNSQVSENSSGCTDCGTEGDEICDDCKENPEQCSKLQAQNSECADCPSATNDCGSKTKDCVDDDEFIPHAVSTSSTIACDGKALEGCGTPTYKERHDVHTMVSTEFGNSLVAISYIIFVILVGFHLNHAIQSAVHTLGIQGPKLTPVMQILSVALSVILVLLFCTLPLAVLAQTIFGGIL